MRDEAGPRGARLSAAQTQDCHAIRAGEQLKYRQHAEKHELRLDGLGATKTNMHKMGNIVQTTDAFPRTGFGGSKCLGERRFLCALFSDGQTGHTIRDE
jgi:hypothetical protein